MNNKSTGLPRLNFVIPLVLGLAVAFAMGQMAGNGDYTRIALIVVIAVGVIVCLTLKTRIWVLVPLCSSLSGKISVLPIPFSVQELSVMAVFGLFMVFYALKLMPRGHPSGWLDVFVGANIAYLGTVFIRNPVGVAAFGTTMVGGKPYFGVLISLMAFWIFSRVSLTERLARKLPILLFIGPVMISGIGILTFFVPGLVPIIAPFYNGITLSTYIETQSDGPAADPSQGSGRIDAFAPVGITGVRALTSYYSPVSMLLPIYFVRFLLFSGSVIAVCLSGYRSVLIAAIAYVLLASWFRTGAKDVIRVTAISAAALLVMILGNGSIFNLPVPIQRTLSFLPGNWNEAAVNEAQSSSEWRYTMWREVWNSDKWITNKFFGDGFGFSEYELRIMQEAAFGGTGFIGGEVTEAQMITGAFHSGPLSAIRYVGYTGFFLFLSFLIYLAYRAVKLLKLAKSTPYFPLALFVCIPMIYEPFNYCFIFGAFDGGLAGAIFGAGMLKMIEASINPSIATKKGMVASDSIGS